MELEKDQVLSYARPEKKRFSKLALVAFAIGILGLPLLLGHFYLSDDEFKRRPDPVKMAGAIKMTWTILILVPLTGIALGIVALARIVASNGRLRGSVFAVLGIVLSIIWPIGVFAVAWWGFVHARH